WRGKRAQEPSKYWWQGLTVERFDEAIKFFVEDRTDIWNLKIRTLDDFARKYIGAYFGSPNVQRPLGLMANGLYSFTPRGRPVLWRVLHAWHVCYSMMLDSDDEGIAWETQITNALSSVYQDHQDDLLFEQLHDTYSAVKMFLKIFLIPKMEIYL